MRNIFHAPHAYAGQIHLDQRLFHRRLAPLVSLDDRRLEGQRAQLGHGQSNVSGLGLKMPVIAASAGILAVLDAFVLAGAAKMVGFGVQKRVQRLFHRGPHHFVQMRLDAPSVDLYYRT